MSKLIVQQEQELQEELAKASAEVTRLEDELHTLVGELSTHIEQEARCQLLEEICIPMEKLDEWGGADLFKDATGYDPKIQVKRLRGYIAGFHEYTTTLEKSRNSVLAKLQSAQAIVFSLKEQIVRIKERAGHPVVSRKTDRRAQEDRRTLHGKPYRNLPWSTFGEDEIRFRRILISLTLCFGIFGGLVQHFREPVRESKGVIVPERIARIIKKKQEAKQEEKQRKALAAKKMAENVAKGSAEKSVEKAPEKIASSANSKLESDTATSKKSAESKGVLAFKNDLANLLDDTPLSRMGANAKISVAAQRAIVDHQQRSLIVSKPAEELVASALDFRTVGGSGINTAGINREIDSSRGQRITETEVKITRVEGSAIAEMKADNKLSNGDGPSRTDEEIQIVFDRYKSALYRMYNRELRSNRNLRGKMVLRIVIEPDGTISECTVKSNDLGAPDFSSRIVERVLSFNFGPKNGVPTIAILYPIEFLPAS